MASKTTFNIASKVTLNNGVTMPKMMLGSDALTGKDLHTAVHNALDIGYRGFDSAQMYHNEMDMGRAISRYMAEHKNISRKDIFYTTKLLSNNGYAATRQAIKKSLEVCGLGYIDLFLIHAPFGGPNARMQSWRAIEDAIIDEEIRAGGVSNFGVRHLDQLLSSDIRVKPAVNQLEIHPFNQHAEITEHCKKLGITVEAFCPLTRCEKFNDPTIQSLSKKYKCTPAQLMLRWSVQHEFVPLPKSKNKERLLENTQIDWFEISDEDMKTLDGLEEHYVVDWDPVNCP